MIDNILNIENFIKGDLLKENPELLNSEKLFTILGNTNFVAELEGDVRIYKYSNWEFTYKNQKLVLICVYNRNPFKSQILFFNNTLDNLYDFLLKCNLTWSYDTKYDIINIINGCQVSVENNKIDKLCMQYT
jgi:hypothetical protein